MLLFLLQLLAIHARNITSTEPLGALDPVKQFYNEKIVDSAIKGIQPALRVVIKKMTLELKEDHVQRAPEWLRDSLQSVFGLETKKGVFIVGKIWQKFAVKIISHFQSGIGYELDLIFSRYQNNLEENMLEVVKDTFYWRKLKKRGISEWYHTQIEKVIQKVLPLLYAAGHETTVEMKNDYGKRMGEVARKTLNVFLPVDLQIPDLAIAKKSTNNGIMSSILDKLIYMLKVLQSKIRDGVSKAFADFEVFLNTQIEAEVRAKVKEKMPFY
eukprot:NODE_712_length_4879_cov_0.214435.p2 type:complete len:270 gc:universal NODE_712_length_4879_cov_0.214435:4336-3527(-)